LKKKTVKSKAYSKRSHAKPLYFFCSLDICYHYTYFPVLLNGPVQDFLKAHSQVQYIAELDAGDTVNPCGYYFESIFIFA